MINCKDTSQAVFWLTFMI